MKKILIGCVLAFGLSGCASLKIDPSPPAPPAPTVVISAAPAVVAPQPDKLTLAPVQWHVYNAADLKKLSDSMVASGGNVVIFTLDESDYKNLQDNLVGIDKFIQQQNAIVDFLNKAANAPAQAAADSSTVKK